MDKKTITYSPEARDEILSYFNMTVDEEGYIVDNNDKRAVNSNGKEVKAEDIIGILFDGNLLFEDNIFSIIDRAGDE